MSLPQISGFPRASDTLLAASTPTIASSTGLGSTGLVTNVKDYGAKGDGHTDDTPAIASAMANVDSNNGVLYFPPGAYLTTGSLAPITGIIIQGTGIGSTQILYHGGGYWIDLAPAAANINFFTLRDMQITCQAPAIGALRVGSPSQDYAAANYRVGWSLQNLYFFGPSQTAAGTIGMSVTQLIDHTISNLTVTQFERIAIIDRCQNGTWTRARFNSYTYGPLISNKAGTGTIIPGAGSQDVFINPEFIGPTAGAAGQDTVTVTAGGITFINALYEIPAGQTSTALLHLISSDGASGAASYFKDINGGFSNPGTAARTILFGNVMAAPEFIGTVIPGSGFPPIQFGTLNTPGFDEWTAKFIHCSYFLNQLVRAADSTGQLATILHGSSDANPGQILTQSQTHDHTGKLRILGVNGFSPPANAGGRGISIQYFDPLTVDYGSIQAYDFTAAVYKTLYIQANQVIDQINGVNIHVISSTGMQLSGGVQAATSSPGMQHIRVSTGSIPASSQADVTVTWSVAFADVNYNAVCTAVDAGATNSLQVLKIESFATTGIVVRVANNDTVAHTGSLVAIAMHV